MLKGTKKYWIIAIICGLAAAALFYIFLGQVQEQYRPDDMVKVVRAAQPIPKDQVIKANQLMTEEVPAIYAHPNGIRDASEAVGKIVTSDISAGEEILKEKLVGEKDKADRLAYVVPLNKRAVTVAIDEVVGVANNIKVGDHVDVMVTIDAATAGSSEAKTYTVLTLQDIEVLAVGSKGVSEEGTVAGTLTVAVTPQQAQPLILATEAGEIRLMLRSPVDDSTFDLPPYEINNFVR